MPHNTKPLVSFYAPLGKEGKHFLDGRNTLDISKISLIPRTVHYKSSSSRTDNIPDIFFSVINICVQLQCLSTQTLQTGDQNSRGPIFFVKTVGPNPVFCLRLNTNSWSSSDEVNFIAVSPFSDSERVQSVTGFRISF